MKIILYQCFAEPTILDKRSYLNLFRELNGTFRNEVDLISPVVRVEIDKSFNTFNINGFNYLYIEDLSKYYFIDDKTIVRSDDVKCVIDLYLTEDVLTTFYDKILMLNASVVRQEYDYNDYLVDDKLPCNVVPEFEYGNILFPVNDSGGANYVLTLAGKISKEQVFDKLNPNVIYSNSYALTEQQLEGFMNTIWTGNNHIADWVNLLFNNPNEAFISAILLPFNVSLFATTKPDKIHLGTGETTDIGQLIVNTRYLTCPVGTFRIQPKYNNFLDYSPYTTIELYLPFYGFLELDTNIVMNKICTITYVVDYVSGAATIKIMSESQILYSVNCQVGVQISLNRTNITEKLQNMATLAISVAANVISYGAAGKISAAKAPRKMFSNGKKTKAYQQYEEIRQAENVRDITNIIAETTSGIVSGMQNHIASGSASTEIIEWEKFVGDDGDKSMRIWWRIRRIVPINVDNYNRLIGKPVAKYDTLTLFKGYTEVGACHLSGFSDCVSNELTMINDIIRDGFIINHTTELIEPIVIDNLGNVITDTYTISIKNVIDESYDGLGYIISNFGGNRGSNILNRDIDNKYNMHISMVGKKITDVNITLDKNDITITQKLPIEFTGDFTVYFTLSGSKKSFTPTITITYTNK